MRARLAIGVGEIVAVFAHARATRARVSTQQESPSELT
jgi:hypothetical protein